MWISVDSNLSLRGCGYGPHEPTADSLTWQAHSTDAVKPDTAAHQSGLTNAVKSTLCYLCCLPLVVLSLSFTRLTVLNVRHKILSLDHHWLGSNDFCNCFVSCSVRTHTHTSQTSMAACQNQAWHAISNWDGCVHFGLSSITDFLLEDAEQCRLRSYSV